MRKLGESRLTTESKRERECAELQSPISNPDNYLAVQQAGPD